MSPSAEKLVSFYDGDRTRILIATVIFCLGFLNLLWFAAALSTNLRDAGKSGWGIHDVVASVGLDDVSEGHVEHEEGNAADLEQVVLPVPSRELLGSSLFQQ